MESDGHMVQKGYDDDMLGSAQWDWLEQQLRDDAPVKLIASGIQVILCVVADFLNSHCIRMAGSHVQITCNESGWFIML